MGIRIGNAASPRWYDQSLARLDEYIECLVAWGASSTELVLHRGEADEQTARVHVLEDDWFAVFERYRERGIICHAHAPLHPQFKLERWSNDSNGLRADLLPVLDAVADFSERQGEPAILVLHGASGDAKASRETTAAFISWAASELARRSEGTRLALELRRPRHHGDDAFDRRRLSLASFLQWVGNERVGACWDIGHDWEAQGVEPEWSQKPEPEFLHLVNHVHLHDAGGDGGAVHYPLQSNRIPWRTLLKPLVDSGFEGAITMEIRYRLACAMGDPWAILAGSFSLLRTFLDHSRSMDISD